MSEKLEAKAIEMLDQLAAKLGQVAQQYGPDVVDAGLTVARIAAAQNIVAGLLGVVVAAVGVTLLRRFLTNLKAAFVRDAQPGGDEEGPIVGWTVSCVVAALVSFIGTGIGLSNLLDLYTWVGLFDPKLYIAAKILGLV